MLELYENSYTVRLTYLTGAGTEIDNIVFDSVVPVEQHTWGAIKTLYTE